MEQVRLKSPQMVEVIFHHLLGKNETVTYHTQSMDIGLFSREEYVSAMTEAGLIVVEEFKGPEVRGGAYIGKLKKPESQEMKSFFQKKSV